MEEQSFLDHMLSHLRSTSKYYTRYPKDLGPSRIIHFTSERQFVQLLHEDQATLLVLKTNPELMDLHDFMARKFFLFGCPYTKHLDKVLEEAAAEFYPHVKFLRG